MKTFTSQHGIGERVLVNVIQTSPIYGYVRNVTFTNGKVRYGIFVKEAATTLHNIDSTYVQELPADQQETINFEFDNGS